MEIERSKKTASADPEARPRARRKPVYLDENVPHKVRHLLTKHRRKATTSAEAGMNGTSDKRQLRHAASMRAIMVTRDDDFFTLHATRQHSGIVKYPANMQAQDVAARLVTILKIVPDFHDTLVVANWRSFLVAKPNGDMDSMEYPNLHRLPNRMPPPRQRKDTGIGRRPGAGLAAPEI
jgi:predicted nuclease of predicted toxin-antitoxin system